LLKIGYPKERAGSDGSAARIKQVDHSVSDGDKSLDASGWSTMRGKKILVIIITLALLLACIIALRLRRDKPVGPSVSETSRLIGGPAFEVQVEMPAFNSGRAPWEIPGVILGYDQDRGSIRQVLAPRSAR
jgi:hypothetical protein